MTKSHCLLWYYFEILNSINEDWVVEKHWIKSFFNKRYSDEFYHNNGKLNYIKYKLI